MRKEEEALAKQRVNSALVARLSVHSTQRNISSACHNHTQRETMRKTKALLDQQVDEIKARRVMESQDLSSIELQLNSSLLKKAEADPAIRSRLQVRSFQQVVACAVTDNLTGIIRLTALGFCFAQEKMSPPRYVDPLAASRKPF
jgi:hypothetical protein